MEQKAVLLSSMVPSLDPRDFELTFESKGLTFLFQDFVFLYYLPGESIDIHVGGLTKQYAARHLITQFRAEGLTRTSEEARHAKETMLATLDTALAYVHTLRTNDALSETDVLHMIALIRDSFLAYLFVDPFYWDEAYTRKDENKELAEVIAIVESCKNVARDKINALCFGSESLFSIVLEKTSTQFSLSIDDLVWYRIEELLALYKDGVYVSAARIEERKVGYAMYIDRERGRHLYEGQDARAIWKQFTEASAAVDSDVFRGKVACRGSVVRGRVVVIAREYADLKMMQQKMEAMHVGEILVSENTDPSFMPAFEKAAAVVTDLGGLLSHAAITAREMNIPCIVDTKHASKVLKTGDLIEVDAERGVVRILDEES